MTVRDPNLDEEIIGYDTLQSGYVNDLENRVEGELVVQDTYSKATRKELRELHTAPPVATGNFNAYFEYGGTYRVASAIGSGPSSGILYGFLEVISSYSSDGWVLQRFTNILNYVTYTRVLRSATWSAWKEL